jgi:hypothetical protein
MTLDSLQFLTTTGDEEQQVVEDKYVGLPSSEEARLKLPSWSELLGTTKNRRVGVPEDNNVGLAGRYNGQSSHANC